MRKANDDEPDGRLAGFGYAGVSFDAHGHPADPTAASTVDALVDEHSATDVLVLAHGWNNDVPTARALYTELAHSARQVLGLVPQLADRRVALVGLHWPARKFGVEHTDRPEPGAGPDTRGARAAEVRAGIGELAQTLDLPRSTVADIDRLVPALDRSPQARREFVAGVRALMETPPDDGTPDENDACDAAMTADPEIMLRGLSADVKLPPEGIDSSGPGVSFGNVACRYARGAVRLLNLATYATMRYRAGTVGRAGVAALLAQLQAGHPDLRLHLAGHSFGARLVAAAATGWPQARLGAVALLQGAFSQFGFATRFDGHRDGIFRGLLTEARCTGPVLVTHTHNDRALAYPYALASMVLRQAGVALGGGASPHGAIGRNGARRTPEADELALLDVGGNYDWRAGRIHNLRADVITNHGDVAGPEVAYAVLHAMTTT